MAPIEMTDGRRGAQIHGFLKESSWGDPLPCTYECKAVLYSEPAGGYSAIAKRLPGVASQGETEEEALANLKEAFAGAVALYLENPGQIPWTDEPFHIEHSDEARERWILVNV